MNQNKESVSTQYTQVQLSQKQDFQPVQEQELNTQNISKKYIYKTVQNNHIHYRPDIDGLRTIAITLVLIYHAFPQSLTGGFIGVDVFFVISGYLISQIIVKQLNQQRFSFINFYIRRIKRIIPALFVVLAFTFYISFKYSNMDQYNLTRNTLSASLVFGANLQILSHQKGYWDLDIRKNPLLHLWSLGVEEQFYMVWPILLILLYKFWKNKILISLVIYGLISFGFQIGIINQNAKFAFYFPLCRFWQMTVGGIIGYAKLNIQNKIITNILSIIGTLSILITSYCIDQTNLFPGYWALIPTFGAAFIIESNNEALINKYILSSGIFVFIGKISYSLYLWHWPLLVFSKTFYPFGSSSILSNTYFILGLTVLLSILSYYLIQNPIRKTKRNKLSVMSLIILILILGYISVQLPKNKQKQFELDQELNNLKNQLKQEEQNQQQSSITIKEHQQTIHQNKQNMKQIKKSNQKQQITKKQINQNAKQQEKQQNPTSSSQKQVQKVVQQNKNKQIQQQLQQQKRIIQKAQKQRIQTQKRQNQKRQKQQQQSIQATSNFSFLQYFKLIQKHMKPKKQDFIQINGKKHPNLSINPNRVKPTIKKIKASFDDWQYDNSHQGQKILQKDIQSNSIFYVPNRPNLRHYHVANQGKSNILLLVGDSHITRLTYRFQQLFFQARQQNKLNQFPTIVDISSAGMRTDKNQVSYINFALDFARKHKPKRVLIYTHWFLYWCTNGLKDPVTSKAQCSLEKAQKSLKQMIQHIKIFQQLGAQVSALALDIQAIEIDPTLMVTLTQVIQKNIQPFQLSDFRNKFGNIIQKYEQTMSKNNVKLIDLSKNLCWQDKCEVLTPKGYGVFTDPGHYGKFYSRHWLSMVDHLVQF